MRLTEKIKINLFRNFWKFLLISVIIILLSTSALVTFVTRNAIDNSITQLRRSMPAVVTAVFDESRMEEALQFVTDNPNETTPYFNFLSPEQMEQISRLDQVRFYDYSIPFPVSRKWLHTNTPNQTPLGENEFNSFTIFGTSRNSVTFIESGDLELTSGRTFLQSEMIEGSETAPLLISEELAQLNDLNIGDILYFEENYFYPPEYIDPEMSVEELYERYSRTNRIFATYRFEIVGLFTIELDDEMSSEDRANRIMMLNSLITPNWRTYEMHVRSFLAWVDYTYLFEDFYRSQGYFLVGHQLAQYLIDSNEPFFVLYDILDFEKFEEAASVYLPEFWEFQNFFSAFEFIYRAFIPLRAFMNIGLIVVIGATIILMNLMLILIFRDRKKEVAIYLALGEKKQNILRLMLTEIFIVTSLSFALSFVIANMVAPEISHRLVQNELMQEERDWQNFIPSQRNVLRERGFGREVSPEELMESFDSGISLNITTIFIVGGFIVIGISTIAPLMMLFEQKPKDLLSESKIG